ncbi:hypothetical protein DICPUDRAFT_94214 [Dictyostelium purpureum]|uniref:Cyclopropane-fatty-acyl-phospholipid synthase n=1 Tax=Dictyostelium purpureum TaxID=5786 RepID=F0ZGS6_DICPU|nr:uncharacterized protein DICPUDRAFT_94214 [Dictyostelium purpureum]EGC36822.1 hypothetical protein DICPUDRAFT_94214 [Dictyostelium purpureum]|eukprot:XP_003286620.1 hypothetical protein DICPUDRAFT_94214 [Dictyostelium purpureum]
MLTVLIPSSIKNYTSSTFVSLGHNYLFKTFLPQIKKGQLKVEIVDENYPNYKTNGNPMVFGSLDSDYDYENVMVTLTIKNLYNFMIKILFSHDIGLGESFILGDFVVSNLKEFIKIFLLNFETTTENKNKLFTSINDNINLFVNFLYNKSVDNSRDAIKTHYNISNEMYEIMLGPAMCYSSGLFKHKGEDLYAAQMRKIHTLLEKSNISKDDHILEIGCGWGTLLIEAAKKYGCRATGISISEEQVKYGRDWVKREGLDHLVDLQVCHYRDVKGKYSRIVSVEMMEHLGSEHHGEFFKIVDNLLEPNGLFVFQVITCRDKDYEHKRMGKDVGFINKYIFLGSELACVTTIVNAATTHSTLELQNADSIGPHYSYTLDAWRENLINNSERVKQLGLDQQFINMFDFYLSSCSACFETRYINDFQFVYSRPLNTKNLKTQFYN